MKSYLQFYLPRLWACLATLVLVALFCGPSQAQEANVLPFQGQLANQAGQPLSPTNSVTLIFRLYTAPVAGTAIWEESQSNISVNAGRFSVLLGSRTQLPPPSYFSATLYLGITVDDGNPATADVEMRPRQALVPVIFAKEAANSRTLNGMPASAFVTKAGDAMTGPLRVPANGLVAGGNQLVLTNGNVGIGTTSPRAALDVRGTMQLSGGELWTGASWPVCFKSPISSVWRTTTPDLGGKYLGFGMTDTGWYFIRSAAADTSAPAEYPMTVSYNGNVGIWTTSPQNKLDVAGSIRTVNDTYESQMHIYSPTISSNSKNSYLALDLVATDYNITAGVTDTGYRIGLGVQGYVADPEFKGTLEQQYAIWARHGSYNGDGRINNSFGVFIDTLRSGSTTFGHLYGLWQDSSSASNYFGGNVGIGTSSPSAELEVAGVAKATVFTATSDRNAKENFATVDRKAVLEKVSALPIARWSFKSLPGADHIGPMAQDFYAAFGVGSDDKHIATVDAEGVALAAIQGLNQKLEEEMKAKDAKIATLESRLADLEKLFSALANKGPSQ